MRMSRRNKVFGVGMLLLVACRNGGFQAITIPALDSGTCAGCQQTGEDELFSFVVRTDADYRSLSEHCFQDRIREDWRPPRPGRDEVLVYVSIRGGGCKGCLDVVSVREGSEKIVVEVEGGFQGACEMLIMPGAWALMAKTDKPVTFQYRDVVCP
jgi:hypothetical protein